MKPNWKYISLFIILAFVISTPIHLGLFDKTFQAMTTNWIISDWVYLVAGLGPFIAGLITLGIQKSVSNRITIWGDNKGKYVLIALLPVVTLSIIGMDNPRGINVHYYGFIYSFINVIYVFLEEFGWRRYLQNALDGFNKNWKYVLIGIIWWLWHMRFDTNFDLFIFPIICIGGGYLLGKLTDDTRSIIPVITIHTLIILLTNTGAVTIQTLIAVGLTIIGWLIVEQLWKRKKSS